MADDTPREPTIRQRLIDLALRRAGAAARQALDRRLARAGYSKRDVRKIVRREGRAKRVAAAAIARLATRSVPGALVVGGAVAAGALLKRRNAASEAGTPEKVDDREE